ncbi:MAG: hypothetical protein KKF89_05490, partial [Nanoarchaeota archaeon]|nr:hypothetical protein [Nanoarchaeota archaeon]
MINKLMTILIIQIFFLTVSDYGFALAPSSQVEKQEVVKGFERIYKKGIPKERVKPTRSVKRKSDSQAGDVIEKIPSK